MASHFRDLLVSKTPETIDLLEVGDHTKAKYLEQSKKVTQVFLLEGLQLANDCDLKYKTSKNQRLLVELCLMQLASITFDGEKKNNKHYIIPPSYFKNKGIQPIAVSLPKHASNKSSKQVDAQEIIETPETVEISELNTKTNIEISEINVTPTVVLKSRNKRTSGLSLSSIKAKKEHLIKQMDVVVNDDDLPKEEFTEELLIKVWNTFTQNIQKQGKYNLASILSIDTPKLKGTTIFLEFPNSTNKVELERQQYDLLSFLRKTLNNFDINLSISVNEEMEKQYAYTPKEKFEKLKEKNPNIDLLRTTFDLDI